MPIQPSTLADLRKAGLITSREIVAAIDRYVLDPTSGPYRFVSGHSVDIAAAVEASPGQFNLSRRLGPHEKSLRNAIATIVMAAHVTSPGP
jgi:hypothetical protein